MEDGLSEFTIENGGEEKITNIQKIYAMNHSSHRTDRGVTENMITSYKKKQTLGTARLSDVHQIYQDFYLTDLKQEVKDVQKIAT